jgi:transposase
MHVCQTRCRSRAGAPVDRSSLGPLRLTGSGIAGGLCVKARTVAWTRLEVRIHKGGMLHMQNEEVFVGIDISKDQLDVHMLPKGMRTTVKNDAQGIVSLIEILRAENPMVIVMEATGGYEISVAAELGVASLPVAIVNPAQVRDFAKGIGKRAKTDAIDAYVLAQFAQTVKPTPKPLPTDDETQIKELVTRRRQLVDLRASEKNRFRRVRSNRVRKSIQTIIAALDKEIKDIDKDIDGLVRKSPLWRETEKLLRTFKGVGPVTARVLMAKLPELGHVSRQEISRLVGLAPLNKDSGKKKGKREISGGRAGIRATLYMAAVSAIKSNVVIKPFYERLSAAGKPFKVVITACMRKMIIILNAMLKKKQPFQVVFS